MSDDDLFARLRSYEGCPAASGTGRYPVNTAMIGHWCEVMGHSDPGPAHGGPAAIAPPAMLQAWIMPGPAGADAPGAGRSAAYGELLALLDAAGCTAVVATDCEQEYLRPLRPGDVITFDSVIEQISPRKTTSLGTGHFVTTRTEIRANGEPAATHRFRILKYHPQPTADASRRPRPVVNRDNAGFWEGVAGSRLLLQRCTACGRLRFPWGPGCPDCGSDRWGTEEASGAGTVHSYVVVHHPPHPAFAPPYAVGLVELAEGVRMISNITGAGPADLRIGMPVELEFARAYGPGDAQQLPFFRARRQDAP
ncbi:MULTISPECIES: OB-fold domain-containing protein [Streptomyces]|uniref:3-oxo-23,24-bisnorchol-4,17(20)-dien-22-oyl-CoA hydratase subunit alpha ChsH2 n=1 Tax=Streptomyces luteosporeus TaxID=173856 RepID=A0ABN3TLQ4_9ACTN